MQTFGLFKNWKYFLQLPQRPWLISYLCPLSFQIGESTSYNWLKDFKISACESKELLQENVYLLWSSFGSSIRKWWLINPKVRFPCIGNSCLINQKLRFYQLVIGFVHPNVRLITLSYCNVLVQRLSSERRRVGVYQYILGPQSQ